MEPASQQVVAAQRYGRLSALLIASIALHLGLLAGISLLETVPPRRVQTAQEIPVDLVTEVPPEPAQKTAGPKENARKPSPLQEQKTEAKPKPASPPAKQETQQKPEPKAEASKPASPPAKPPQQQHAEAKPESALKPQSELKPKSEAKPSRAEAKPQAPPPKPPEAPKSQEQPKSQEPPKPPVQETRRSPPPIQPSTEPSPQVPKPAQPSATSTSAAIKQAQKTPLPTAGLALQSTSETFRAVAVPAPSQDGDVPLSYDTIVSSKLELARRFPPEARARGAHGAAMVAFLLDGKGQVVKVKLMRSSGDAALDVESLAMVMRAAPYPPPPPGADREFAIVVDFDPNH